MLEALMPIQFDVVFTTAYDSFAVRAFKYAALNYLLKPIDADDLRETVDRLVRKKMCLKRNRWKYSLSI